MSVTIDSLPELSSALPEAFAHVRHGSNDYKLPLGSISGGAKQLLAETTELSVGVFAVENVTPETAYREGVIYWLRFTPSGEASTYTINIDSLGAVALKKYGLSGTDYIDLGDIAGSSFVSFFYDGTDFILNDSLVTKIYSRKITLSKAVLSGMSPGSPYTLVSAPGAGYAFQLFEPVFTLNYQGGYAAWVGAGNFVINHPSHGTTNGLYTVDSAVYTATQLRRRVMDLNTSVDIIENELLRAFFVGAAPTGGDSSVTLYLTYKLIKL